MKNVSKLLVIILLIVMTLGFIGCEEKPSEPVAQPDTTDDNYRVFYQIFVGSFSDSNGDGIGDLRGIINRFDYLNDGNVNSTESLGVQGIWLSPIFTSPSYHKYDTTNYYEIDPKFGTMADLEELIELCHSRNVKLILDLVLNHTSNQHQYFKQFVSAHKFGDTEDPYYDYYCYGSIEDLKGKSFYKISGTNDEYYEGNFSSDMPEPNFDNAKVRQDCVDVAKYYLDKGIDGFRFDAIKYIYYGETERSVEFWDWYMDQLKAIKPDIYCVGECWSSDSEILQYTSELNCFAFQTSGSEGAICNGAKLNGSVSSFTNYVISFLDQLNETSSDAMFIPFFSNHDQDRSAGYPTYANKQMAANLYILCSGSPFIYYGEEIGMTGSRGSASTDANRRMAMVWGDGDTVANPEGTTYKNQIVEGVSVQDEDEDSLLNHYRKLISIRIKYPEIARGNYTALTYSEKKFGGFKVEYQGSTLCILHNTDSEELQIDLGAKGSFNFDTIAECLGGNAKLEGSVLTISGQTTVIIK